MEKVKYNAKIYYTMKETHPDFYCIADEWTPEKEFSSEDTYFIDTNYFWGEQDIYELIKEDMLLVAGGGYDWKHIDNVRFEIKKIGVMK